MTENDLNGITEYFENKYLNPVPALKYGSAYQLLVAVILSAQCTDERVNKVTEKLFAEYGEPEKMLRLSPAGLEKYIFSCGLYKTKAAHIISASNDIVQKYGGKVPETIEELKKLAGVGQKTANVVYSVAFSGNAIAVDTHVFRVANRLGLAKADNVSQTEKQLEKILPENKWSKYHHYLIFHGREVCTARNPHCEECRIKRYCEYYREKSKKTAVLHSKNSIDENIKNGKL